MDALGATVALRAIHISSPRCSYSSGGRVGPRARMKFFISGSSSQGYVKRSKRDRARVWLRSKSFSLRILSVIRYLLRKKSVVSAIIAETTGF